MSHGEYTRSSISSSDDLELASLNPDHSDRTGLDASPIYPSSPRTHSPIPTPALDVEGNSAFADPTEEGHDAGNNAVIVEKRKALLRDLLVALDAVVYIELAVLYYLDNSTLFFALRSLAQLAQITAILNLSPFQLSTLLNGTGSSSTPASSSSPLTTSDTSPTQPSADSTLPILDTPHQAPPPLLPALPLPKPTLPGTRPNIILLLALNALITTLHILLPAPSASETTRFYMHGSLILDFIGQRAVGGWMAKVRLVGMDVLVAVLQVGAAGVVWELGRKREEAAVNVLSEGRAGERVGEAVRRFWSGVRIGRVWRGGSGGSGGGEEGQGEGGDVEMRLLRRRGDGEGEGEGQGEEEEVRIPRSPLDVYTSGQAVVVDVNLVNTVRRQFWELRNLRLAGRV